MVADQQTTLAQTQNDLNYWTSQQSSLQVQLNNAQTNVNQFSQQVNGLEAQLSQTQSQLNSDMAKKQQLDDEIHSDQNDMNNIQEHISPFSERTVRQSLVYGTCLLPTVELFKALVMFRQGKVIPNRFWEAILKTEGRFVLDTSSIS
jgi:hypothetical protein